MRLIGGLILAACCIWPLVGCGQKGPLYLPPQAASPQSKAPPADVWPADRPYPDVPATNEKK